MSSARLNAEMYWAMQADQTQSFRSHPSMRSYQFMLDAALWKTAFHNLANGEVSCPSEAIESAINEINSRFDGDNVLIFRRSRVV